MKVVICWSHISGYMAATCRALAAAPGVSVFVLAFESESSAPFDPGLFKGVPYTLLDDRQRRDANLVRGLVADQKPDVLMVSGWAHKAYRAVVTDPKFSHVPKLMTMDTQLRMDVRQAIGRRLLKPFFKHIDRVVVAGERAAMCARYYGFRDGQIRIGALGIDCTTFRPLLERRSAGAWPRKFLYAGRYAADKGGLGVLVDAYTLYRTAASGNAWELVCCGKGPERHKLNAPGITDLGFIPPDRQAEVFLDAGAFVMPSLSEAWGVAIVEAAVAGLPLVCSDACGANAEVLRDGYNGYRAATGDAAALARAFSRIVSVDGPTWGGRSRVMGEAFDAATWPARIFDDLL